jgi:hypothetical protein
MILLCIRVAINTCISLQTYNIHKVQSNSSDKYAKQGEHDFFAQTHSLRIKLRLVLNFENQTEPNSQNAIQT